MFGDYRVVALHKVGLVGKKGARWAKDSLDFLGFICKNGDLDSLELVGIEIKSRQSSSTVNAENDNVDRVRRGKKYLEFESKNVFQNIKKASERYQLLHHAYVYGFNKIFQVVGTKGAKVLSCSLINYENDLLNSYGKVMEKLKDDTLHWAYDSYDVDEAKNIVIPDDVIALSKKIKTINGKEGLYSAVKLWKFMFDDLSILPRPALKRIIPRSHAKWNANKGGSDAITKIVDNCYVRPPTAHTNYETTAVSRCFSNLTAAFLRIYQCTSAKPNIHHSYKSLPHFKDAASKRMTHQKALRYIYRHLKAEVKKSERGSIIPMQEIAIPPAGQRRAQPNRTRFRGRAVPVELQDIAAQTFKTPQKAKKKQIEQGAVDKVVEGRTECCPGLCYEVIDQGRGTSDQRQVCYRCGGKTKWRCLYCRFYFCMSYSKTKLKPEELCYAKEIESDKEVTKIYGNTCFHVEHAKGIHLMKEFIQNHNESPGVNSNDKENHN